MKWTVTDRKTGNSFSAESILEIISLVSFRNPELANEVRDRILQEGKFNNESWEVYEKDSFEPFVLERGMQSDPEAGSRR